MPGYTFNAKSNLIKDADKSHVAELCDDVPPAIGKQMVESMNMHEALTTLVQNHVQVVRELDARRDTEDEPDVSDLWDAMNRFVAQASAALKKR